MHFLAPNGPKHGMVMKQCEDEIASMNMAVGAGQMGVRSMTATSGGGFALMTEAVGLAGMLETPLLWSMSSVGAHPRDSHQNGARRPFPDLRGRTGRVPTDHSGTSDDRRRLFHDGGVL